MLASEKGRPFKIKMKHIASVSFGKDSLAMLLKMIEEQHPLDEVVFYDTGMEFKAIYDIRDKILPILKINGIKYKELRPVNQFEYDMLQRPKVKRDGTKVCGDGWCGGACRWGTFKKQAALNNYIGENITYIGLAADEQKRLLSLEKHKKSPIAEWKMTEKDCLQYCYDNDFYWEEDGVRLYDLLDRVSCWCCRNKNLRELKNIYLYLPNYWERLKNIQSRITEPMKGNYSVFALEKRFDFEIQRQKEGLNIKNKGFYRELKELLNQ